MPPQSKNFPPAYASIIVLLLALSWTPPARAVFSSPFIEPAAAGAGNLMANCCVKKTTPNQRCKL
jgi:hypothetical protein